MLYKASERITQTKLFVQFTKLLDHSMVDIGEDIKKLTGWLKKVNKGTVIR